MSFNHESAVQNLCLELVNKEHKFTAMAGAAHNALSFTAECSYARQALENNGYLAQVAEGNQKSFFNAIYNVATIGISLNPATAHAYLVPRKVKGKLSVCLDIGYRGFIKLATDSGCVVYMKAELVHENDDFTYHGFDARPEISVKNPFDSASRGKVIGVIAWAKLHDGSYLNEYMNADEIMDVRNDSEAYKSVESYQDEKHNKHWLYQKCPWVAFPGEMTKKTIIKRLYKTLPASSGSTVMAEAIEVVNEHEGINFQPPAKTGPTYTLKQSEMYAKLFTDGDYVGLLCLREQLDIDAQNDLWALIEEPTIEKGNKGKHETLMRENLEAAREMRDGNLASLRDILDSGDESGAVEFVDECSPPELDYYLSKLSAEHEMQINSLLNKAA